MHLKVKRYCKRVWRQLPYQPKKEEFTKLSESKRKAFVPVKERGLQSLKPYTYTYIYA